MRNSKMKKNILKFVIFISLIPIWILSGCSSLLADLCNQKADIPFSGTMDTRFGYENFYWGMPWNEMKKMDLYPLVRESRESKYVHMLPERSDYSYFYGTELYVMYPIQSSIDEAKLKIAEYLEQMMEENLD